MATTYQVFFTPLVSVNTYGSEIEVTDRIEIQGIGRIVKTIDAEDYDIGALYFGDITLKGVNKDGYFNENDSRSIFVASRDLTKVRIVFDDGADNLVFRGLISDRATRLDVTNDSIRFKVLSFDSVIKTTKVAAGLVTSGTSIKNAIISIMSQSRIAQVLTTTAANINPDLNETVDVGSAFDNKPVADAITELLGVSNSVMQINDSDEVIVSSRDQDDNSTILNLYGKYDIHGRENIARITGYNNGKHRQFTSVKVNDTERNNTGLAQELGEVQKTFVVDWITDSVKEQRLADRILDEFKAPKIELKVEVKTSLVKNTELLDRVSVNYPYRAVPADSGFLPAYDIDLYGSAVYPNEFGSVSIDPNIGFKVLEIIHNPKTFTSQLKLRQIGKEIGDGLFSETGPAIYDFAIYGDDVYSDGGQAVFGGNYDIGKYDNTTTTYG